jgi:hypothetical protein
MILHSTGCGFLQQFFHDPAYCLMWFTAQQFFHAPVTQWGFECSCCCCITIHVFFLCMYEQDGISALLALSQGVFSVTCAQLRIVEAVSRTQVLSGCANAKGYVRSVCQL